MSHNETVRGSILIMSLVLVAMSLIMIIATTAYVSRQYNQTVRDEAGIQSLYAAQAGINYVIDALANNLYTPQELLDLGSFGIPSGSSSVALFFEEADDLDISQGVQVTANGLASNGYCSAVAATLHRSIDGTKAFSVTSNDYLNSCDIPNCWAGMTGVEKYNASTNQYELRWGSVGTDSCRINGEVVPLSGVLLKTAEDDVNAYTLVCDCTGPGNTTTTLLCQSGSGACALP